MRSIGGSARYLSGVAYLKVRIEDHPGVLWPWNGRVNIAQCLSDTAAPFLISHNINYAVLQRRGASHVSVKCVSHYQNLESVPFR